MTVKVKLPLAVTATKMVLFAFVKLTAGHMYDWPMKECRHHLRSSDTNCAEQAVEPLGPPPPLEEVTVSIEEGPDYAAEGRRDLSRACTRARRQTCAGGNRGRRGI